jgi:hypothetical protein
VKPPYDFVSKNDKDWADKLTGLLKEIASKRENWLVRNWHVVVKLFKQIVSLLPLGGSS